MPQEFYSNQEAEEILQMASRSPSSEVSRQELSAMASELGISELDLAEAENNYREVKQVEAQKIQYRRLIVHEFTTGIVTFLCVNAFLILIWAMTGRGFFWPAFPICGWGLGVVIAFSEMQNNLGSNFETKFAKWKLKQDAKKMATKAFAHVVKKISQRQ